MSAPAQPRPQRGSASSQTLQEYGWTRCSGDGSRASHPDPRESISSRQYPNRSPNPATTSPPSRDGWPRTAPDVTTPTGGRGSNVRMPPTSGASPTGGLGVQHGPVGDHSAWVDFNLGRTAESTHGVAAQP